MPVTGCQIHMAFKLEWCDLNVVLDSTLVSFWWQITPAHVTKVSAKSKECSKAGFAPRLSGNVPILSYSFAFWQKESMQMKVIKKMASTVSTRLL